MRCVKARRKDLIKNRKDKRYIEKQCRLECAIGKFLKMGWLSRLKTSDVSNEAKVWNSTFYDHYIHMDEAIDSYFHKMEPELKMLAREVSAQKDYPPDRNDKTLEAVFFKILYFVYRNQDYYSVIISQGNSQVFMRIAESFEPVIKQDWSNYGLEMEDRCFCVFSWELGGLLYFWGRFENFDFSKIAHYARKLSRLAQNATKRLAET